MKERHLFKAKCKDNDEWVKGALCETSWGSSFIIKNDPNIVPNTIKVDPDTICQCTGLRDHDGNLIYENDLVASEDETCVIKWDEESARYLMVLIDDGLEGACNSFWTKIVKVVGNVVDNPELLEVDHDGE